MKNLFKLSLFSICFGLMFTACETDPIDPTNPGGPGGPGTGTGEPEVSLASEVGFVSSDATVGVSEIFHVKLSATKGEAVLTGVILTEDGGNLPNAETRVTVDDAAVQSNTIATLASEKDGFVWDVAIAAHADVATKTYGFVVVDSLQNRTTVEVSITTTQTVTAPSISFPGNTNPIVAPGTKTCFIMDVAAGNPPLDALGVYSYDANGDPIAIDPSRVCFGSSTQEVTFTANPMTLEGDDRSGFNKNLCIRALNSELSETYLIALFDESGEPYGAEVIIDTRPQGMSLNLATGILLNRAGPAGTGGLDFDNLDINNGSVGSADAGAEIKDEGIDMSQGNSTNWIQRFSGVNGTVVKQLVPNQNGLSENFTFESVTTDIQLTEVWGNGQDFTSVNSTGEPWSKIVEVGDIYIANNGANYYLFVVREVNATATDNGDNYVFDVAY